MTSKSLQQEQLCVLEDVISAAKKAGAEHADALIVESDSLGVSCRMGEMEDLERSEAKDLGLRVLIGKQQAVVSTSDINPAALAEMAQRAVDMARHAPEDPWCGLADESELTSSYPENLDLFDPTTPEVEGLFETARIIEHSARSVEGITNSEGASASWGRSSVALMTSHGFAGSYEASSHSMGVSVIAGEGTGMERDYEFDSARHMEDLENPEAIGLTAANNTLRRLNPDHHETCKVPVVFDPRVGSSLLGHLSGAINGASVARGTSFLKDAMGSQIFAQGITVLDDPLRVRGLRSKAFDGEGIATRAHRVIDQGVLGTWFLDSSTARQLNLPLTGNASRGTGSVPGAAPTNLYMEAGSHSVAELIGDIESGFFVTELIGMGVNGITGDYSRGASGFWIENGEIAGAVSGMTIAGNLKDIYLNLTPADDLVFRYGTNVPTLRIEGLTLAGT
jgi:PmbA protein